MTQPSLPDQLVFEGAYYRAQSNRLGAAQTVSETPCNEAISETPRPKSALAKHIAWTLAEIKQGIDDAIAADVQVEYPASVEIVYNGQKVVVPFFQRFG